MVAVNYTTVTNTLITTKLFYLTIKWPLDVVLFSARDYELRRDHIKLQEVLGEGQFGDVHKGFFTDKVSYLYIYVSVVHLNYLYIDQGTFIL